MIRQGHTSDIGLVKSREMKGRTKTLPWWLGGEEVKKDDRKQNTLARYVVFFDFLNYLWFETLFFLPPRTLLCEVRRVHSSGRPFL
jgi:hypothetical protein